MKEEAAMTRIGCSALGWLVALFVLAGPAMAQQGGGFGPETVTEGATPAGPPETGRVRTDRGGRGAMARLQKLGGRSGGEEVSATMNMAVRSSMAFGNNIIGEIPKGQKFTIKSRENAWFQIAYSQEPAYVYITYIEGHTAENAQTVGGQLKVKQEAYNLLRKEPFPYDPATNGGSLGCAQVVSTALEAAGVLDATSLAVLVVIDMLKAKGWQEVNPPPWADADVVCWSTYDTSGDGVDDPDTHIGIVVKENGVNYAINNSSSNKRPEKHNLATYGNPVTTVLRAPGL
jgi:hypothetical protein